MPNSKSASFLVCTMNESIFNSIGKKLHKLPLCVLQCCLHKWREEAMKIPGAEELESTQSSHLIIQTVFSLHSQSFTGEGIHVCDDTHSQSSIFSCLFTAKRPWPSAMKIVSCHWQLQRVSKGRTLSRAIIHSEYIWHMGKLPQFHPT